MLVLVSRDVPTKSLSAGRSGGGGRGSDSASEEAGLCLYLVQLRLRSVPAEQRTQEEDI